MALGFVLHAPDLPWSRAGFYGLLSGLVIYATVQATRWLWRTLKPQHSDASGS